MERLYVTLRLQKEAEGLPLCGRVVKLLREGTEEDPETVRALLPEGGAFATVANTTATVLPGTRSAGFLSDCMRETAIARVLFPLGDRAIAEVLAPCRPALSPMPKDDGFAEWIPDVRQIPVLEINHTFPEMA